MIINSSLKQRLGVGSFMNKSWKDRMRIPKSQLNNRVLVQNKIVIMNYYRR